MESPQALLINAYRGIRVYKRREHHISTAKNVKERCQVDESNVEDLVEIAWRISK